MKRRDKSSGTGGDRDGPHQAALGSLKRKQPREGKDASSTGHFCRRCVLAVLMVPIILFMLLWAYPSPIDPVPFRYSENSVPELVGPLAINDALKRGEKLFENEIMGPEALVLDEEGNIYSGLGDGRLIRIDKDLQSYTTILRTGSDSEECGKTGSAAAEAMCGRPLGMVFNSRNTSELYVIDSSLGLLKVNVESRSMETLISKNNSSVPVNFLNDLIELPNGSLLITDSSLKFSRHDNHLEGLECGSNGQLLVYNPEDGSLHVVMQGLHFPNGLCLSREGKSVLIVETTRARILRYYFDGDRAGATEVFSDNFPSWPDNITPSSRGGYWVGNAVLRSPVMNFFAYNFISFRSLLAKFHLLPLLMSSGFMPEHGLVLELDEGGRVVGSLHDEGGETTTTTSHILERDKDLLIGSYHAPYLIRLEVY